MPTVEKLEKYDVQGENTEVKDEIRENVRGTLPAAKTKLMHTRSAFSDTDLKRRLATSEKGGTADNGVFSRYSESDLAVARLSVPLFDDSRSEASGESGLAIVPYGDERNLVLSLPDGWPQFKNRPWRRRSCELVQSTSSCVRKAVAHLHQLQDLVDLLHKTDNFEGEGRSSKRRSSSISDIKDKGLDDDSSQTVPAEESTQFSSASSHGRRIHWLLSSASLGNIDEDTELSIGEPRLESSASGATLEVRGRSAGTVISKASTVRTVKIYEGLPKEYDVIEEVISLLGRMESDRVTTEETLAKEKERVQSLRDEIDSKAKKRLHDLPLAVQREHEACAMDINELRWHCAYQGRIEARIQERVHHAEKLELEGDAMSSIQLKQDETDDELLETLQRLEATERKTAEAQGKAAQERSLIKQDVDVGREEKIRTLEAAQVDKLASMESENSTLELQIANFSRRLKELTSQIKQTKMENTSLNREIDQWRQEVLAIEESLRTTAEALRKQLKDEAHARTVLQARITSDSQDLSKTHDDSKKKREKALQRADEIEKLVENVGDQKETMEFTKRLDHITWKSEMMQKKMADMESSSQMMNKVIATTQESLDDLSEEMTELKIQIEAGFATEQDLKKSLQQIEGRIKLGNESHRSHMSERDAALKTNQAGVTAALSENKKLALRYQKLQNAYLNDKAALLRLLEGRVNNEDSLKEHRELLVLQARMRQALEYFYRLRGLQSKADIADFELKCIANGEKLVTLQSEMMKVIEHINRFLEANNASHNVISLQAAESARTPASGTLVA
ncbi:Coiled-coil domain-containing protein 178 [Acropora cervicornis]|uniref:Coiled-coil domain-containing protein 178 n=1 Tax=Acropora cervicornis TaxID=6130 RepID=A0AAD9R7N2_ACRCE|nr:Coiled-coil domain-containing protein 178 [Acropora cervicornis]